MKKLVFIIILLVAASVLFMHGYNKAVSAAATRILCQVALVEDTVEDFVMEHQQSIRNLINNVVKTCED